MFRKTFALLALQLGICFICHSAEEGKPEPQAKMNLRQKILLQTVELKPFDSDKGLEKLIDFPKGKGNAADYYAKLEILYTKDKLKGNTIRVRTDAKGIDEILKAAQIAECHLTPDYYPHMDKGTCKQPDLMVFEAYLHALLEKGKEVEMAGDLQAASRIFRSALTWGWHLTKEKPSLIAFMIGLSIKVKASEEYGTFLARNGATEKAAFANAYTKRLLKLRRHVYAKATTHLGDFVNFNCLYAAIKIAKYDQDYMWRQEAVLRLGVLRHGAPDPQLKRLIKDQASQKLAEEALTHVSQKDPAEWIRKLAIWSVASVTPQRFQEMQERALFGTMMKEEAEKKAKKAEAAEKDEDAKKQENQ